MINPPIYQYIIITSAVIGIIRFPQIKLKAIQVLIILLLLTVIAETLPSFKLIQIVKINDSNHWFYNIFTVIEFLLYTYIFSLAITNAKIKSIMRWSIPTFLIVAAINIFFIQKFYKFHTISYRIGAVMIVIWCYLYFRQLLQLEEDIVLAKNPMFWVSTGLLFFYLGFFVYMSAFDVIVYKNLSYNKDLWHGISYSLNTLLYCCFLIALLCPPRRAIL
jgi:hypothetical protein